jgi:hypothetical protein
MSPTLARLVERSADTAPNIGVVYWNRLEPRPRSPEIADALGARVRDPLWILTRQWQWGEFSGEDAGSPAYVQIDSRTGSVTGWRAVGGAWQQVGTSLEQSVESEGVTADLATRIELGQRFERLLAAEVSQQRLANIIAAYRTAFPPSVASIPATDVGGQRLATIAAGRAIDGVAVAAPNAALPNDPDVNAESQNVRRAITALSADIAAALGTVGSADAPSWRRDELAYRIEVAVDHPSTGPLVLRATPDRDATFEWFAFDAVATEVPRPAARRPALDSVSCLPAFVSFRGMPNHRWWDFERGTMDFGAITPDRRDIAKLLLMDFMLIHGNDYFMVPFEQRIGTVCQIERVLVHDVFGMVTLVERADLNAGAAGKRWTCFSLAKSDRDGHRATSTFSRRPLAISVWRAIRWKTSASSATSRRTMCGRSSRRPKGAMVCHGSVASAMMPRWPRNRRSKQSRRRHRSPTGCSPSRPGIGSRWCPSYWTRPPARRRSNRVAWRGRAEFLSRWVEFSPATRRTASARRPSRGSGFA